MRAAGQVQRLTELGQRVDVFSPLSVVLVIPSSSVWSWVSPLRVPNTGHIGFPQVERLELGQALEML